MSSGNPQAGDSSAHSLKRARVSRDASSRDRDDIDIILAAHGEAANAMIEHVRAKVTAVTADYEAKLDRERREHQLLLARIRDLERDLESSMTRVTRQASSLATAAAANKTWQQRHAADRKRLRELAAAVEDAVAGRNTAESRYLPVLERKGQLEELGRKMHKDILQHIESILWLEEQQQQSGGADAASERRICTQIENTQYVVMRNWARVRGEYGKVTNEGSFEEAEAEEEATAPPTAEYLGVPPSKGGGRSGSSSSSSNGKTARRKTARAGASSWEQRRVQQGGGGGDGIADEAEGAPSEATNPLEDAANDDDDDEETLFVPQDEADTTH